MTLVKPKCSPGFTGEGALDCRLPLEKRHMEVGSVCRGPSVLACSVKATGEIGEAAPGRFQSFEGLMECTHCQV